MYRYFQPTYVKSFRCDGQACGAQCCRAGWAIEIDDDTRKKYLALDGLADHLSFNEQLTKFCIEPNDHGVCPFLGDDDLCSIQKKYGEAQLSETCRQYPRQTLNFGEYFERSLSLVCPLVADMVLNSARIDFEWVEVDERTHRQSEIFEPNVPIEYRPQFASIQQSAIAILQCRSLPIADRLRELMAFFDVEPTDCRVPDRIDEIRLENYLVHEFFINAYPCRFDLPLELNLKIFLSNAEELIARSPSLTIGAIRKFVTLSNHDMDYISDQINRLQFA